MRRLPVVGLVRSRHPAAFLGVGIEVLLLQYGIVNLVSIELRSFLSLFLFVYVPQFSPFLSRDANGGGGGGLSSSEPDLAPIACAPPFGVKRFAKAQQ